MTTYREALEDPATADLVRRMSACMDGQQNGVALAALKLLVADMLLRVPVEARDEAVREFAEDTMVTVLRLNAEGTAN